MKVFYREEERWPDYELFDSDRCSGGKPKHMDGSIEVSAEVYAQYVIAADAYRASQRRIRNIIDEQRRHNA